MPIKLIDSPANVVIFDIDGCCIESDHRLPHLIAGDRATYDSLHLEDSEITAVARVYRMLLGAPDLLCLFVTSRRECAREYTSNQLRALFGDKFLPENLLMRPIEEEMGTDTPDAILKPRLVAERGYQPSDILFVIEDRNSMVARWRELGVVVMQPRPGDF